MDNNTATAAGQPRPTSDQHNTHLRLHAARWTQALDLLFVNAYNRLLLIECSSDRDSISITTRRSNKETGLVSVVAPTQHSNGILRAPGSRKVHNDVRDGRMPAMVVLTITHSVPTPWPRISVVR